MSPLVTSVPLDQAPKVGDLLKLLKVWDSQPTEQNTLLLLSLGMLPTDDADPEFWFDLHRMIQAFKSRHNARVFDLSREDRAFMVKMTEYNQVSMLTDAKLEILRLIQSYFPEQFGMLDQSRLLRSIDLRFKLSNAIRFLERYVDEEQKLKDPTRRKSRRLGENDIERVVEVKEQIGNPTFKKVFVRDQRIVEMLPGGPPQEVLREYFVGMDALKHHVFRDVELRGSGNIFNQLTITLDRLLLDAFEEKQTVGHPFSINLNVESVFTRAFEQFASGGGSTGFQNLAFEFRQANVLQQYDEYAVAASLITSKGGSIAIDAVFPETVGIVNMARLNANIAKIFWRQGAEMILPDFEAEIDAMQEAGTRVVLARVDDELGIEVGQDLGITMFQGFYVDDLMKD